MYAGVEGVFFFLLLFLRILIKPSVLAVMNTELINCMSVSNLDFGG